MAKDNAIKRPELAVLGVIALVAIVGLVMHLSGESSATGLAQRRMSQSELQDVIKDAEAQQETLRNKRQMSQTAFQNYDQRQNQLYNTLSSVMKTQHEMGEVGMRGSV